jgi:hypothetical protein
MAKQPIEIGALSFPTKDAAKDFFRAILYRYPIGTVIPEPDATHLHWLLERHPDSATKAGRGIAHFSIRSALYGTRCFEVERPNGENTDFSFKSCIDGKHATDLQEALKALRAEVVDEIRQKKWSLFRSSATGTVACAITGRQLTLDESFVDHTPPHSFKSIALRFIEQSNINVVDNFVTIPKDNQYQPRLIDRQLATRWKAFYDANAIIRVVAKGGSAD